MPILQTKALKKYYGTKDTEVRALDGVDLSVEVGEFVSIVGTSGSGKSTLLHMLGGLDRPTSGQVFVDGQDIFSLKDDARRFFAAEKSVLYSKAITLFRCSMYLKISYFPLSLTETRLTKPISSKSQKCWV